MICSKCGYSIPDNARFCPKCGTKAIPSEEQQPNTSSGNYFRSAGDFGGGAVDNGFAPRNITNGDSFADIPRVNMPEEETAFMSAPSVTVNCPVCGSNNEPDTRFCGICGTNIMGAADPVDQTVLMTDAGFTNEDRHMTDMDYATPAADMNFAPPAAIPKKPRRKLKMLIIIASAVVFCIAAVLVVGFATDWFGLYGPAAQIASAAESTLNADNLTAEFELSYREDGRKKSELLSGKFKLAPNFEERNMMMIGDFYIEGTNGIIAIYKNQLVASAEGSHRVQDMSEYLNSIYDSYEKSLNAVEEDISWKELLDSYDEGLYAEASKHVDFDALDLALAEFAANFNDEDWLIENAGFSETDKNGVDCYVFKPNLYKFSKATLETFKDIFVDPAAYNNFREALSQGRAEFSGVDVEITFGIKSGELVQFKVELIDTADLLDIENFAFEISFSDINATEFDTEYLDSLIKK